MLSNNKKTYKVLAMISKKDGGTHWMRIGTAYQNKDDSINAYVDAFPREGKLQIRELDEEDLRQRESGRAASATAGASPPAHGGTPVLTADGVPF